MIELFYLFYTLVVLFWAATIAGAVAIGILIAVIVSAVIARRRGGSSYSDPTPPPSGS